MNLITRWFPYPYLSLLLAVSWLLLNHTLAPLHLVAAMLLSWAIPRALRPMLGHRERVRWLAAARLCAVVLWDILVSNLRIARLVLTPNLRPRSAWLSVPLATRHERANALLATIITTTPGTVSVTFGEERLLVHMLDCPDPDAAVAEIVDRYQKPLLTIFHLDLEEKL